MPPTAAAATPPWHRRVLPGIDGQAALEGRIRRPADPGLVQDPQAVELAGRLDDPGQHQLPEHLIPGRGLLQAQHPVGVLQGIRQVPHPRGRDRQRPAASPGCGVQAQVKLALPGRHPLHRRSLQRLQLGFIVRRADVLDLPRPPPRGPRDLHRRRARRRLHRPHIRHRATLRPPLSAQIRFRHARKPQLSPPRSSRTPNREPSQVVRCGSRGGRGALRPCALLRGERMRHEMPIEVVMRAASGTWPGGERRAAAIENQLSRGG
jgi:hypothetical protein